MDSANLPAVQAKGSHAVAEGGAMSAQGCSAAPSAASWAVSRFYFASLGAVALHGVLLLVRPQTVATSAAPQSSTRFEQLIELEAEPQATSPATSAASAAEQPRPTEAVPPVAVAWRAERRALHTESPSADLAPAPLGSAEGNALAPLGPRSVEPSETRPERKIDLGLDGRFFMHPPADDAPQPKRSEFQKHLEASLSAGDVQRGLARGNALLGSLSAAVREAGPIRGDALVRVTVGADGGVSDVQLVQGNAAAWASVLRSFRELATRKRVRVPPGARGLRVTFNVRAKVQRLSGSSVDTPPIDVARPSLDPNGLTPHGAFDLTDLAGGAQRLVYARVVSEEVL